MDEIYHEITPLGTPQYNGVAESALSLLKEKSVAMLETMKKVYSPKLWAEAMSMACDMSNVSATTANGSGVLPFEKWHEAWCSLDGIQPFGTVGYVRLGARGHKLAPWGENCIMLGMAHNHPSGTEILRNPRAGEIVCWQGMTWHPPVEEE